MNTRDILARVNEIAELAYKGDAPLPVGRAISALRDDLESSLRLEMAASKGTLNATKTVNAMLAEMRKSGREALSYAWIDEQGRQCACDGYRAYRLTEHLPLEPRPDNAAEPLDLDKIMPDIACGMYAAVSLPSVSDLRAYIAVERAKIAHIPAKRRPAIYYDLGDGSPVVNAQYLLDMLAVFPDAAVIFCNVSSTGRRAPLVIRSERGDGLLMPCSTPEKAEQLAAHFTAAGQRIQGYPLPDGTTPTEYARRTLRESSSKAIEPDVFAACLDMIAVA